MGKGIVNSGVLSCLGPFPHTVLHAVECSFFRTLSLISDIPLLLALWDVSLVMKATGQLSMNIEL